MSNIATFPNGVDTVQRGVVAADFIPNGLLIKNAKNLYSGANGAYIIDVKGDLSECTDTSYMFNGCNNMLVAPELNTSNVTDMSYMFQQCAKLMTIPLYDTSNVKNMTYMFYSCQNLRTIPPLDTSNVTNVNSMFYSCGALTEIPELDFSNVTAIGNLFGYSSSQQYLLHLGGFKNLGMYKSLSGTNQNYFIGYCNNLTKESVMNVINNLYDRASAGYSVLTLKLHANHLAMLSDEEKAIATNKGWTLA